MLRCVQLRHKQEMCRNPMLPWRGSIDYMWGCHRIKGGIVITAKDMGDMEVCSLKFIS